MSTKTNRKKCLIIVAAFLCSIGSNAKASFASGAIENVVVAVASLSLAAADTWTAKAPMPTARAFFSASAVDGRIYAIGGTIGGTGGTSAVEEYDPATDTWTKKASLPTPRMWLSTSMVDGRIYAIGGATSGFAPSLSTVEVYDPTTDTWAEKAPMLTTRLGHSTSVVDGKIYAIGGWRRPPDGVTSDVEEYDPATDTWTKKAPMPTARFSHSTSVVDGKIYAIGGGRSPSGGLSTVEAYDPVTDTWNTKAPMPTIRQTFSSTSVVNGIIYVIGGGRAGTVFPTVEAYDPATDTWTKKTDMPTARGVLATSAVNGKIYAIGGSRGGFPWRGISTVEEYDTGLTVASPDFNGDGIVDSADMGMMVDHWHTDNARYDIAPAPFGDGIVDIQDLIVLAELLFQELNDPTLIAHWALDETEGIVAYDSAGYNDAFLLVSDPLWQPSGGQVDGALQLDGVDDCAITGSIPNPTKGAFSVFAWVKGGAPDQAVLSQAGGARWLCADPSEGNLMTELKGTGRGANELLSQTVITDGNWHRIGLVWDGSNRTLYVDDIAVAEDTQTDLGASENGLYIGAGKAMEPGSFWSGLIDDVRIYNRAVSP